MTINLTREDFEQAIKSGASVFEGNTILDTGKPSGRYYRFIRVPLANGEHKVDALYGQRFYGTLENKPVTFNQEVRFLCLVVDNAKTVNETLDFKTIFCRSSFTSDSVIEEMAQKLFDMFRENVTEEDKKKILKGSHYFGCIENALQTLYPVSVLGCYELGLNYACDPEGFTTSLLTSLSRRNFKTTSKETPTGAYIPKKVAAARLASKMTNMFVPTKNESQKAARHLLNSHKGTICKKNIVDVTLCNKSAGNMQIKIPLDNFLYYEPKTKEIFVNICDICEGERKKVNRYVKDCGFLVRENLVPMMLVQRFEA